jgi:MipA family protein
LHDFRGAIAVTIQSSRLSILALPAVCFALPAAAQDVPQISTEPSVFDGDFLIVGAGAAWVPDYEGSDDMHLLPVAGVAGRVGGVGINPRAAGIALDVVADSDKRAGLTLGPVLRFRSNRTGVPKDPVVASLGKLKGVIEAGVTAGVSLKRVFNPHDSLSMSVDVRWDVSGRGSGYIVSPGLSYLTPLSRAQVAGLAASANFIDRRYARYNFEVTPAAAAASGLPVYDARGGFKDWSLGAFTARDLNGNFVDGGLAVAVGAMYSRLYGSAAESPITAIRGRRSQWVVGGGLAFVF